MCPQNQEPIGQVRQTPRAPPEARTEDERGAPASLELWTSVLTSSVPCLSPSQHIYISTALFTWVPASSPHSCMIAKFSSVKRVSHYLDSCSRQLPSALLRPLLHLHIRTDAGVGLRAPFLPLERAQVRLHCRIDMIFEASLQGIQCGKALVLEQQLGSLPLCFLRQMASWLMLQTTEEPGENQGFNPSPRMGK
jgi:hypothetical protein